MEDYVHSWWHRKGIRRREGTGVLFSLGSLKEGGLVRFRRIEAAENREIYAQQ